MKVYQAGELKLSSSIVTIGAFDGLHRGHQGLIKQTVKSAKQNKIPSVVYTFDPPPRSLFQNKKILMNVSEKTKILQQCQVDYVVLAKFDEVYASRLPIEFINELKQLHPRKIVVGPNFTFGKGKQGEINLLAAHYNVYVFPYVFCNEGHIISSTRIRELLDKNELKQVENLLGRKSLKKIKI